MYMVKSCKGCGAPRTPSNTKYNGIDHSMSAKVDMLFYTCTLPDCGSTFVELVEVKNGLHLTKDDGEHVLKMRLKIEGFSK